MVNNQSAFTDGLDFLASDINISPLGYKWLINARQRFGYIQANKQSDNLTEFAPAGKKQGLVAIGSALILFVSGKAYFQFDGESFWSQIAGFAMDANVPIYYTATVPDSTFNFTRALNPSKNIADPIIKNADVSINGIPGGLLVQDGINQPSIITFDNNTNLPSSRVTQTFIQWGNNNINEYVPIGTIMLFVAPKLLIVSADGSIVYHSISGRPLDFMINVDIDGNKLATEDLGGAKTVSFTFDFDGITCLSPVNIPSSFFIASRLTSRIITFDFTQTVFGEPNVAVSITLSIGADNRFSFLDILGDYSLIDTEGIKSFNAVQQFKVQGRNSIFSLTLQGLLQVDGNNFILQDSPNCISFNNYGIYSIKTNMGHILCVYDMILGKWVALDIIPCSRVKQFAVINEAGIDKKLYAITAYDEVFQLYSSANDESAVLFTRAFTYVQSLGETYTSGASASVTYKQSTEYFKLLFQDGSYDSTIRIVEYVDGAFSQMAEQPLPTRIAGVGPGPITPPVIPASKETGSPVTFTITEGLVGNKIAYILQWKSDAKLLAFEIMTNDNASIMNKTQAEEQLQS